MTNDAKPEMTQEEAKAVVKALVVQMMDQADDMFRVFRSKDRFSILAARDHLHIVKDAFSWRPLQSNYSIMNDIAAVTTLNNLSNASEKAAPGRHTISASHAKATAILIAAHCDTTRELLLQGSRSLKEAAPVLAAVDALVRLNVAPNLDSVREYLVRAITEVTNRDQAALINAEPGYTLTREDAKIIHDVVIQRLFEARSDLYTDLDSEDSDVCRKAVGAVEDLSAAFRLEALAELVIWHSHSEAGHAMFSLASHVRSRTARTKPANIDPIYAVMRVVEAHSLALASQDLKFPLVMKEADLSLKAINALSRLGAATPDLLQARETLSRAMQAVPAQAAAPAARRSSSPAM